LTYQGGAAWRTRLAADIGARKGVGSLLAAYDDDQLQALMTALGGHCVETLLQAYEDASDDVPTLIIAYTVKGFGLPCRGTRTTMRA